VTNLRKTMLEELERRNYSESTTRRYLRFVERFAQHFGKSPDKLGPDHLRSYQAYLLKVRKLDPGTVENHVAALRFLFIRTLDRHEFRQFLPYPKVRRKLPKILSREEVARLIDASSGLFERTLLMVLYGTGMRRAEIARLKIADIDSQRMVIHVVNGKGGKDRDLPLSPALLETLLIVLSSLPAFAADVTGTWTAETSDINASLLTFVIKQEGAKLTGTVATPTETTNISNGKVNGDKISFAGTMSVATFTYEGTIAGDEIKVTVKSDNSDFPAGELTLKRSK
jgi:integrase